MSVFRVLVADDHPVFRLGLCSLIRAHEGWQVCGEASDGREAVEKCKQLKPDLVILDICMPTLNGADAARQILKNDPIQKILVLTDVDSEQVIRDCLGSGVHGWVFKRDGTSDLLIAVQTLQHDRQYFSPRVSDLILDGYLHRHRAGPVVAKVPELSSREREVAQLLAEGKTSKEVATLLNISTKTVETHRSNLMYKLKIHSIVELVMYAVRNELVHVPVTPGLQFRHQENARSDVASQALA